MLVTSSAVDLVYTGATVDLGPSNICVECHQARTTDPFPEIGGDSITISSIHWAVHHGTESQVLWGVGGIEFQGSVSYPEPADNSHIFPDRGCLKCHKDPNVFTMGGHTFKMEQETAEGIPDYNLAACSECHPEITSVGSFDLNGRVTEISTLFAQLAENLITRGYVDPVNLSWVVPVRVSAAEAGAMLNFKLILEDGSAGIHNYEYTRALLINSNEALNSP
jgi:hypothetical protein